LVFSLLKIYLRTLTTEGQEGEYLKAEAALVTALREIKQINNTSGREGTRMRKLLQERLSYNFGELFENEISTFFAVMGQGIRATFSYVLLVILCGVEIMLEPDVFNQAKAKEAYELENQELKERMVNTIQTLKAYFMYKVKGIINSKFLSTTLVVTLVALFVPAALMLLGSKVTLMNMVPLACAVNVAPDPKLNKASNNLGAAVNTNGGIQLMSGLAAGLPAGKVSTGILAIALPTIGLVALVALAAVYIVLALYAKNWSPKVIVAKVIGKLRGLKLPSLKLPKLKLPKLN
ncbi:MAG: hypothetical protein NT033_07405, partial [Candidatus Omnitrophica bacterium]|nr:hypothetical protein [Candidatus Omnitrophota bacterium]